MDEGMATTWVDIFLSCCTWTLLGDSITEDCAIFNVALFSKDFFSTLTKKEKRNRLPVSSVSY